MTLKFPSNFSLTDSFKLTGSTHDKIMSPEDTIKIFKQRSKSANLEILQQTRRIDNNRLGIPVYFSICTEKAETILNTKKQMGKGATPALAEASAIMELVERFNIYSFINNYNCNNNNKEFINTSYSKVKKQAIPFELIAESVGDHLSLRKMEKNEKIFSMLNLNWIKGYNITKKKEMLIPVDWFFMINEFNGTSAGNSNEEAICQGACEVIERHVSAIIAEKKPELPYINPESLTNPDTKHLIKKFTDAGIKLYINDFTLGTGIPSIGVLAFDPSTFPHTSEIVWTAGTATSPDKALSRALTEVAQLAGDFNTASNYLASGLPKFKKIEQADFITIPYENKTGRMINLEDMPDISDKNIKNEILGIAQIMENLGFEVITIDITNPDLKIPGFYTLIPGTQFRERAQNSSVAMFSAKHIFENNPPRNAEIKLEEMSEILENRYYIKFYQGLCQLALSHPEKALEYMEAAIELEPAVQDIPTIYSYTGVCLKEMGKYKQALEILKKGINKDQDRDDIYNLMGYCNFMLKRHTESISCFEKVLELKPGSGIDHASIASNYRELGNTKKAIEYYEMALLLDPSLDFAKENLKKLKNKRI